MNKTINITVRNKIAKAEKNVLYICGNSDFVINFNFDEEWDEFTTKTARFVYNGEYKDVEFDGAVCPVPIISNTYSIKVGVFAGDLRTTTPAYISAKKSILCESVSPPHSGAYPGANSNGLPSVTALDNGKFLRVVNGKWAAIALQDVSVVGL